MRLPLYIGLIVAVHPVFLLAAESNKIAIFCEERFPDNYVMQDYCIEQQREAGQWILKYMSSHQLDGEHPKDTPYGRILIKCMNDRGENFVMGKYCIERQTEAYDKLHRQKELGATSVNDLEAVSWFA